MEMLLVFSLCLASLTFALANEPDVREFLVDHPCNITTHHIEMVYRLIPSLRNLWQGLESNNGKMESVMETVRTLVVANRESEQRVQALTNTISNLTTALKSLEQSSLKDKEESR